MLTQSAVGQNRRASNHNIIGQIPQALMLQPKALKQDQRPSSASKLLQVSIGQESLAKLLHLKKKFSHIGTKGHFQDGDASWQAAS